MKYEDLDDLQLDAVKEVANIGAAHAATALSQLLDRRVDMSTPRAELRPMEEVVTTISDDEEAIVVAIHASTKGDAKVDIMVIFSEESILHMLDILTVGKPSPDILRLSRFETSICREVGNILLLHYVRAINTFMNMQLFPTVPVISIDMAAAVLQPVLAKHAVDNDVAMTIEVDIFTDQFKMEGNFVMLPDSNAMDALMVALFGDEGWEDE